MTYYDHNYIRPARLDATRFAAWAKDVQKAVGLFPIALLQWDSSHVITPARVFIDGNERPTPEDVATVATFFREHGEVEKAETLFRYAQSGFGLQPLAIDLAEPHPGLEIAPGRYWNHVATNDKPYDVAIVAALMLLAHHMPDIRIQSSGDFAQWRLGREIAQQVTGIPMPIPTAQYTVLRWTDLDPEQFAAWTRDVRAVINAANISLTGPDGRGAPVLTEDTVAFNGIGADGYDPFIMTREPHDVRRRSDRPGIAMRWEIQTLGNAGKRYDEIVTAALILWSHYFWYPDELWMTCRGYWDGWRAGCEHVKRATGVSFTVWRGHYDRVIIQ